MILASLFEHLVPEPHNRHDLAAVPLVGCDVANAGMTMVGVVPVNACAMSVNRSGYLGVYFTVLKKD